jgi:hypothetical protein
LKLWRLTPALTLNPGGILVIANPCIQHIGRF